ncbi:MAG: O-acetyl-ADP-ribose deacetylase [Candidatus Poribacteria bacterium]|nr:O-acetyl-ADP-ribose deacetylase [Candidatus Poribacteria bacterium]MDE0502755.1 O-acetyl-ADP-ribose deacetylase [Candidatus Poribacteria bacterium]
MYKLINQTTIKLVQGDITKEQVDAITNAANEKLAGGGGVDGAIHRAGGPAIMKECDEIRNRQGGCPTGQAVITTGGNLPAGHVIHTVGPIWHGGNSKEPALLASCYRESLGLALRHGLSTIAFPSISTGIYGYPTPEAAAVALNAVKEFVDVNQGIEEVRFVLFDDATYQCFQEALSDLKS